MKTFVDRIPCRSPGEQAPPLGSTVRVRRRSTNYDTWHQDSSANLDSCVLPVFQPPVVTLRPGRRPIYVCLVWPRRDYRLCKKCSLALSHTQGALTIASQTGKVPSERGVNCRARRSGLVHGATSDSVMTTSKLCTDPAQRKCDAAEEM